MLRSMLIDMNSFFASCEQQCNPKLRGKPIAVVPMLDVPTATVLASSVQAKRFGIKTGTLVGEALRLCPEVQFVAADHSRYLELHEQIKDAIETLIPVDQVLSVDEFSCRLSGSQQQEENAVLLARTIKQKVLKSVGSCLTTSIGIAENTLIAKIASDLVKPDGLVVVSPGKRKDLLSALSVRVVPGVGPKMEQRLNLHSVFTLEDFFKLSRDEVRKVWGGVGGDHYYDALRGADVERSIHHDQSLGHQHVLEPELRNKEGAGLILKKLLVRASVRLRRKFFYARVMTVGIQWQDGRSGFAESSAIRKRWTVRIPETNDPILLLRELDRILQQLPDATPILVGVTFSDLVHRDKHQFALFENPRREELLGSMDQINSRFGKNAVTLASIHEIDAADRAAIAFSNLPDREDL